MAQWNYTVDMPSNSKLCLHCAHRILYNIHRAYCVKCQVSTGSRDHHRWCNMYIELNIWYVTNILCCQVLELVNHWLVCIAHTVVGFSFADDVRRTLSILRKDSECLRLSLSPFGNEKINFQMPIRFVGRVCMCTAVGWKMKVNCMHRFNVKWSAGNRPCIWLMETIESVFQMHTFFGGRTLHRTTVARHSFAINSVELGLFGELWPKWAIKMVSEREMRNGWARWRLSIARSKAVTFQVLRTKRPMEINCESVSDMGKRLSGAKANEKKED